ncbi:MAG TPA: LCP family protein [Candidatus Gemmiger excrementigallinarum]|uniref:LCP family protein n=1 Tax=Candidatus Gemmiger excrementigallinarum TaxID=2838609 RepID=A0A9D2JBJ1_9FIRM|nr:LCP family protein [Candidatus Gemmiger excrementigallinarum]
MSEPRKVYTGGASGSPYSAAQSRAAGSGMPDQDQYEAARRRAQQLANQNARRRVVQQPVRAAQGRHIRQTPPPAQEPVQQPVQQPVEPQTPPPVQQPEAPRELTHAQRQAMAYRAAAERKYGNTVQFPTQRRTVRQPSQPSQAPQAARPRAQVQNLDVRNTKGSKPAYDYNADVPASGGIQMEEAAPAKRRAQDSGAEKSTYRSAKASGGNGGRKPPRDGDTPRGKKSGKKGDDGGKGGKGKKKKKGLWWKILLATLCIILLIFGGAYAFIMAAIAPEGGAIKISQLINTPKEFQGKELNILVTGVDRSSTGDLSAGAANDTDVNDGMTDMILYVHFNNETGELKMLQIPRDMIVTTDRSVSGNYRINAVAKTQGSDSNNNMAALCELVADQLKVPIDGYMTIRLEMLVELVDLFGGVELYVPQEMDYGGSHLDEGYQTLNGAACEFLLRTRKIYPDGDIGRLNMQRQFYAALFRKLKSIGNIWDVAKLTPAVLNYMETDLSASQLVSFAVSMLNVDSNNIMICQLPVKMGQLYQGESVVYPARQEDADLLNQYFRENTGPVDASQLNLCDSASVLGFDISGLTATDPNIQQMGGLMSEADKAQHSNNLDGSAGVVDVTESESTDTSSSSDSSSDSTSEEDSGDSAA